MKTIKLMLVISAMLMLINNSNATVRSVSNIAGGGAQYADLQTAYDNSNNGDTLLIEGSATNYVLSNPATAWSKSLVVIGPGINSQKQLFVPATFYATQNGNKFEIGSGGGNSRFYGIRFWGYFNSAVATTAGFVNGLVFEDCIFEKDVTPLNGSNIIFRNCIFNYDDGNNIQLAGTSNSLAVYNCIFDGVINTGGTSVSMIVDHCVFLRSGNVLTAGNVTGCLVKNSIFYNAPAITGLTGGVFNNNVARNAACVLPPAGCSGTGNQASGSTVFFNASVPVGTYWTNTMDFHLITTPTPSLAVGTADDASDMGVHGGGVDKFSEKGEPLNVIQVRTVNIMNNAAPNGTLNVQISAGKPNDQ